MQELSQANITRIVRSKMRDNSVIILANAHEIRANADALIDACKNTNMEDMSNAARKIVEAAIGCRSRLQYMRGTWAVLKEVRREPSQPNQDNEGHEGLA